METQDPLTQLADIHLPDAAGWWPPAPGWWVVVLVLLALILMALAWVWRQWRRRQRLRIALGELDEAWENFREGKLAGKSQEVIALELLNSIQNIMRRVALQYFPVETVAPLSGQHWIDFLQQSDPDVDFNKVDGLGDSAYRKHFKGDPEPAYLAARQWIHHRYLKNKHSPDGGKQAEARA